MMGIEIGNSDKHSIVRQTLIDAAVDADRLFRSQGGVAKPLQAQARERPSAKPFKKRNSAKTISYVRSQLCVGRTNVVSDRAVTGNRFLGVDAVQRTRTVCSTNAKEMTTNAERKLEPIIK